MNDELYELSDEMELIVVPLVIFHQWIDQQDEIHVLICMMTYLMAWEYIDPYEIMENCQNHRFVSKRIS